MIYFITDGTYTKIGYTGNDTTLRLSTLQTGNPNKLELLFSVEGDAKAEKLMHEHFKEYRHNGEWFLLDTNVMNKQHIEGILTEMLSRPKKRKHPERRKKRMDIPDEDKIIDLIFALGALEQDGIDMTIVNTTLYCDMNIFEIGRLWKSEEIRAIVKYYNENRISD